MRAIARVVVFPTRPIWMAPPPDGRHRARLEGRRPGRRARPSLPPHHRSRRKRAQDSLGRSVTNSGFLVLVLHNNIPWASSTIFASRGFWTFMRLFFQMSNLSQVVSAKVEQAKDAAGNIRVPGFNKDRCFTLLVIDDANTDWSKYFRGRRVHDDWDIRVEQAEFSELAVTANTEQG